MQHELFQPGPNVHTGSPLIGCAGWGLPSAEKHRFPETGSHLERYAAVLPCVEINTSFYRLHRPDTYARWRDSVPDTFRFSVKLLRTITHFKQLRDCAADLEQFLDSVSPLAQKWGCLLVQFPPSFAYPGRGAMDFFARLRERVPVDIACEPRHASWFDDAVAERMQATGIAYVEADPPVTAQPTPNIARQPMRYIRLHGSPVIYHSSYPDTYLKRLADELGAERAAGRRNWCIFDNTASGAAVSNALSLLETLSAARAIPGAFGAVR